MAQSLSNILLHIIFSTKDRMQWIRPQDQPELNSYLAGIVAHLNSPALIVNSVDDHVHALCRLARTMPVSKLLEEVKKSSSRWIKTMDEWYRGFVWQAGYGAFSVSESRAASVKQYIARQAEHHKRITFEDEFRRLLLIHNVEFDEKHLFS